MANANAWQAGRIAAAAAAAAAAVHHAVSCTAAAAAVADDGDGCLGCGVWLLALACASPLLQPAQ